MTDFLFPEAQMVLEQALERHAAVWPFVYESIDLSHVAHNRVKEFTAPIVPGVPRKRRVRNDISDDCWRFLRSIADPLVEDGRIYDIGDSDGGDVLILPDGLHVRIKKCDHEGNTANYPTPKIGRRGRRADQWLFSHASELDRYIADGLWIDVVFEPTEDLCDYEMVAMRFSDTTNSPMVVIDPPSAALLHALSPVAAELASTARARLTA